MKAPRCKACGKEEWRHVCVNTKDRIVNTTVNTRKKDRHSPGYMRMYMRVWRAVGLGKAMWLKKGERHEAA